MKKIMYDSDEAAQRVTITGWMSKDGFFWPEKDDPKFSEHHARWSGCTHIICECGAETEKTYTRCLMCRSKAADERYKSMPEKEWKGEPLVIFQTDTYFFSECALRDYCEEHDLKPSEIQLCICESTAAWTVDPDDVYQDYLPEDQSTSDVAPKTQEAFNQLNVAIVQAGEILSWSQGKHRTTVKEISP